MFFFQVFASSLYFKNRFVSHQQLNRCHSGCMYICVGCGISCCVNLFSRNGCFYAVSIRRTRTKRIQRSSGFIIFTAIFSILAWIFFMLFACMYCMYVGMRTLYNLLFTLIYCLIFADFSNFVWNFFRIFPSTHIRQYYLLLLWKGCSQ